MYTFSLSLSDPTMSRLFLLALSCVLAALLLLHGCEAAAVGPKEMCARGCQAAAVACKNEVGEENVQDECFPDMFACLQGCADGSYTPE